MENDLRQAATVFDNSAEGVIIAEKNGTIIGVNRAFCTITGYERDEVIGQTAAHAPVRAARPPASTAACGDDRQHGRWQGEVLEPAQERRGVPAVAVHHRPCATPRASPPTMWPRSRTSRTRSGTRNASNCWRSPTADGPAQPQAAAGPPGARADRERAQSAARCTVLHRPGRLQRASTTRVATTSATCCRNTWASAWWPA